MTVASWGSPPRMRSRLRRTRNRETLMRAADGQAPDEELDGFLLEDGVYIVGVDAAADDPAPGLIALDVGDLRHWVLEAGLGPQVVDEAGALFLHRLVEFAEEVLAGLVLQLVQLLAVHLRLDGVHHHQVVEVVDPEILDLVVAQVLDGGDGGLLGFFLAQLARLDLLVVVGHQTVGHFHQVAHLFLAILHEQGFFRGQHHGEQHHQAQDRDAGEPEELGTNGNGFSGSHGVFLHRRRTACLLVVFLRQSKSAAEILAETGPVPTNAAVRKRRLGACPTPMF